MNDLLQRIIAFILFILLLPVNGGIFIFCIVLQGFPVFYCEKRLGLCKKEFIIWKFRTMAEKKRASGVRRDKSPDDPRITTWGHFLHRFSIDELPQLWNVIKSDMVLVGPRPITAEEDILYRKYSDFLHPIKTGITGLWQVSGRNLTTYHRRIAINRYYVTHRSWILDLWTPRKTIKAVLSGRGAY